MGDRFEEYKQYCEKYESIYGKENTVVLYQCGKFYEIYGVDNSEEKIGKVSEIADLLRIVESRVNTKIIENSRRNPQMAGFNCVSLDRFMDILIDNDYTVVIVDQLTPPPKVTRGVTAVWSHGTYIDSLSRQSDNYLVSIYIESEPHKQSGKKLDHIGMAAVHLATGKNFLYEVDSSAADPTRAMDEAYRFIQSFQPVEVLVNSRGSNISESELLERLDISHLNTHIKLNETIKELHDIPYQRHYLHKIFPDHGQVDVLAYLHLELLETCRLSYILLLQFCEDHKTTLLRNLNEPVHWEEGKNLVLDNNAICQLNLNDEQYKISRTKHQKRMHSVLSVIDYTKTNMGRRLLRERLMRPSIDTVEIEKRYSYTEFMLGETQPYIPANKVIMKSNDEQPVPWWRCVEGILNGIKDIERLHRRIQMGTLTPAEFGTLDNSYRLIESLIYKVKDTHLETLFISDQTSSFLEFLQSYTEILDVDEAKKYTTMDITDSFFKLGYNTDIDKISSRIKHSSKVIQIFLDRMSDIVRPGSDAVKYKPSSNDDSYFLDISKPRFKTLTDSWVPIQIKFEGHEYTLDFTNLDCDKRNKSNVKMTCPVIDKLHRNKLHDINKLRLEVKRVYSELLEQISQERMSVLDSITNSVAAMDLYMSIGKLATLNNYCRPTTMTVRGIPAASGTETKSWYNATGLRHPIIERIVHTHYVSHDIEQGKDVDGILLYGINQTGKSSTMKAIGIAIVMAQAGFYVPATTMSFYPYQKLMTRILGNDKMHGGLSSFAVEMGELRSILIRSDKNTMVLGDEICHGTETKSAVSLVTASIEDLAEKGTTFVFATHLHQLSEMDEIRSLDRVKQLHLTMHRDQETGDIVYDRNLKEGSGCDLYGIEVARALRIPFHIIEKATNLRKKYFNCISPDKSKKSTYNSEVYQDYCVVCKQEFHKDVPATETHHIYFQSEANPRGFIGANSMNKHHKSNLVPLCENHHQQVHHPGTGKELIIVGYEQNGHLRYFLRNHLKSLNCTPIYISGSANGPTNGLQEEK